MADSYLQFYRGRLFVALREPIPEVVGQNQQKARQDCFIVVRWGEVLGEFRSGWRGGRGGAGEGQGENG